jgi:hypothetical protein
VSAGVQQLVQTGFNFVQLCFTICNEIVCDFLLLFSLYSLSFTSSLRVFYVALCYTVYICILNCVLSMESLKVSWHGATELHQKYLVLKGKFHTTTGHKVPDED